jgi:hypothetical protein
MSSLFPNQVGWIESGAARDSRVIIGKDVRIGWEALGYSHNGRPDIANQVIINLTRVSGVSNPTFLGSVIMDVSALVDIISNRPLAPTTGFQIAFREVAVCEDGSEKAMLVLASQTYNTGVA